MDHNDHTLANAAGSSTSAALAYDHAPTLKRRASPSFEGLEEGGRKRVKEDYVDDVDRDYNEGASTRTDMGSSVLADGLAEELQCGCCSALVYRPVIVSPCQHFFCGSCCVLWIRNGGTNCPACRGQSTIVTPFRAIQSVIDLLLRVAPHKVRSESERQQADEIYKLGQSMRLPTPREASPEPNINQSVELARPCPHCASGNPFGWSCPQPITDPSSDPDHAWRLENGTPPGHAHCGNCENLLALHAPSTTKCDFCQVHFCGISVQGRCIAAPLISQHPHGMTDIGDLILSADVYECFESNTVEVEILLDYLAVQHLTPRHIYREIVMHIQAQPRGFSPLIELDLFTDIHGVAAGIDPDPEAPRHRICRVCAAEVLLWGLKEWWVRERQKGFLDGSVLSRKDCSEGSSCNRQKDLAHAREFNHIFGSQPRSYSSESGQEGHPGDAGMMPSGSGMGMGGMHPAPHRQRRRDDLDHDLDLNEDLDQDQDQDQDTDIEPPSPDLMPLVEPTSSRSIPGSGMLHGHGHGHGPGGAGSGVFSNPIPLSLDRRSSSAELLDILNGFR